jgi:phage-related minor tail protein
MISNKTLIAGLLGALVSFLLGWLVWGVFLRNVMMENVGSATGVMRGDDEMIWWALILGQLFFGLFLALIFSRWAGISTFATGAKAGAVLGGLMALYFDLMMLATTHIMTPTGAVVDIIANVVVTAITGGAIGWYLGRKES